MKNIIILVALSTSLDANAQSMITGVVLDESGVPLADAQVAVGEANSIGDATNDEGRFALVGVPGIYFHSLFGSRNDRTGAETSGIPRRINRQKLVCAELEAELDVANSLRARVFAGLRALLQQRRASRAFAPAARQRLLEIDARVFVVVRESGDGTARMLCLHNVSNETVTLPAGNELARPQSLAPYEIRWEALPAPVPGS